MEYSSDDDEVDFSTIKWGSFTRTWQSFRRRNGGPDTLHRFAILVERFPERFRKVTRRRAKFYMDVILK